MSHRSLPGLTFSIFSATSRPRALPRLVGTPRPLTPVSGAPREGQLTDMARVVAITTGAGGRAEAKGETPGLRSREGHEVIRPRVKTGGAGHRPTQEAKGETRPFYTIFINIWHWRKYLCISRGSRIEMSPITRWTNQHLNSFCFKYYLKNTCHDYSKIKQQEALPEKQIEMGDSKTMSLLSSWSRNY